MNPIQILADWYRRQESQVRLVVAFYVGNTVLPTPTSEQELTARFADNGASLERWLEAMGQAGSGPFTRLRLLGHTIMIRGLVTMRVFGDRRTPDDFEVLNEERAESSGEMSPDEAARAGLAPFTPGDIEVWQTAWQGWSQLCNSSLSDEAINSWFHEEIGRNQRRRGNR